MAIKNMTELDPEISDGQLVTRIRQGEIEALGELYERYKTQVYRTALSITHDERAAEDILQDTFLRVYTYAESIDETVTLGPWLYRVTVNVAYTWSNRVKRWVHIFRDTFERLASPAKWRPEMIVEDQEWKQILWQSIEALPPHHRVVIVLHYLEGLSLKEISYITDVPVGTVKSRLHYAREKLKKAIREQDRRLVPGGAYDFT